MSKLPPIQDDFEDDDHPRPAPSQSLPDFDEDLFDASETRPRETPLGEVGPVVVDEVTDEVDPSGEPDSRPPTPSEDARVTKRFVAFRENFECLAIAILLALAIRHYVFEPFQIPTGSMATTLLGKHRQFTCEHCDWIWSVKDGEGSASRVPDDCPHCRLSIEPRDGGVWHGEKILANKMVYFFREPLRWESCVFRPPHKDHVNFIKRIISPGGEKVAIRNGDVYINDVISVKPRHVQDQIWIPVYDSAHDIEAAAFFEYDDGWERDFDASGAVYRYDDLKDRFTHTLSWARAEGGRGSALGTEERIFSELSYNNESTGRVVGDLRVDATVSLSEAQSGRAALEIHDGPEILRLELGAGARLIRKRGEAVVDEFPLEGGLPSAVNLRVSLRNWDEHVLVLFNGDVVFEKQLDPLTNAEPEDVASFRFDARDTDLTLRDLRVWRDIHYSASDQNSAFGRREREWTVPEDMLLVLGDNTDHSNDSRDWGFVPRDNLRGRPWLRLLHVDLARLSDTNWSQVKFGHVE